MQMQWSWAVYWTWAVVQMWSMGSWLIRPQVSGMHAKLKHIKQCWSSSSSSYIAHQIIQIPLPRQDSLFDDFFHLKLTNCVYPGPNFAYESLHNLLLLPSLQSPCIPLCLGRKTSIRRALHSNALSLILHHAVLVTWLQCTHINRMAPSDPFGHSNSKMTVLSEISPWSDSVTVTFSGSWICLQPVWPASTIKLSSRSLTSQIHPVWLSQSQCFPCTPCFPCTFVPETPSPATQHELLYCQ